MQMQVAVIQIAASQRTKQAAPGRWRRFEGLYVGAVGGSVGMHRVGGRRFQPTLKRSAYRRVPQICLWYARDGRRTKSDNDRTVLGMNAGNLWCVGCFPSTGRGGRECVKAPRLLILDAGWDSGEQVAIEKHEACSVFQRIWEEICTASQRSIDPPEEV